MIARITLLIIGTLAILIGASLPVLAFGEFPWDARSEPYVPAEHIKPNPKPQVRGFIQRVPSPKPEKPDTTCVGPVTVIGDQYATESGAKSEAEKSWMATVRFSHGERFMDPAHAKNVAYACNRSSVGSLVGQTFIRCEITALACKAPKVESGR